MEKGRIFTIGHGRRTLNRVGELLKEFSITYLVDVRSQPYSKFNPGFSKEPLQAFLKSQKMTYVFMGDMLGGRPQDDTVYSHGEINYELLRAKDYFQKGIERLVVAFEKGFTLALMCAEADPSYCHRSKLIAAELVSRGIPVDHINEHDLLTDQGRLNERAQNQLSLF